MIEYELRSVEEIKKLENIWKLNYFDKAVGNSLITHYMRIEEYDRALIVSYYINIHMHYTENDDLEFKEFLVKILTSHNFDFTKVLSFSNFVENFTVGKLNIKNFFMDFHLRPVLFLDHMMGFLIDNNVNETHKKIFRRLLDKAVVCMTEERVLELACADFSYLEVNRSHLNRIELILLGLFRIMNTHFNAVLWHVSNIKNVIPNADYIKIFVKSMEVLKANYFDEEKGGSPIIYG
jgi:hypothetical protein